jgi:hypothetical protein
MTRCTWCRASFVTYSVPLAASAAMPAMRSSVVLVTVKLALRVGTAGLPRSG